MIQAENQTAQKALLLSIPLRGGLTTWKVAKAGAAPLAFAGLVFLSIVASQQAFSQADLHIAHWVRSLAFIGLDATMRAMNVLTDAPMAFMLWVIAGAFLVLRGRPLEAVAVFLISGLWVGDHLLGVCPRIRSWRRKPSRNNLLTVIWTLSWSN